MVLIKGVAILEGIPLSIMYEAIANAKTRLKWETLLGNFEVVEAYPDGVSEVIYFTVNAPMTIQNRDFVQKRITLFEYPQKRQILMHFQSIEHPAKPVYKNFVRAHTTIAGYLFKEISAFPLRCSLSIVSQVDIKGLIPKSIVNMCAGRSSRNWVRSYREGCKKLLAEMRTSKKI